MGITCCDLGKEFQSQKDILYQDETFFIKPALGQMSFEGYVLLCTVEHYLAMADLPQEKDGEVDELMGRVRSVLEKKYGKEVFVFEHVAASDEYKRPESIDHAHTHFIPADKKTLGLITEKFELVKLSGLDEVRKLYEAGRSYVFMELRRDQRYVVLLDEPLPSQTMRKEVARPAGITAWNWRAYQDPKTFRKTVNALKGKF